MVSCLRPAALRPGDLVMVVSPSGPSRPERLARGVQLLESWGLRVALAPDVYARHGYLAGTDAQRLANLNAAFADPAVRAVICARGGYGVQRIVDHLDVTPLRTDPKVVVGFSDITALHLVLWRTLRLATVHGPGAAWLDERTGPDSAASLRAALFTDTPVVISRSAAEQTAAIHVAGTATGTLLGGNLCLLAASLATPDFPDLTGAILLLEEVREPPYKVDRMLTQLRRAGVLRGLAGVAIGQFTECADGWPVSIVEVLQERLGDLGVPVLGGLPIGHGAGQLTVPLGVPATIDTAAGTLTVQAAVTNRCRSAGPANAVQPMAASTTSSSPSSE